VDIDPVNGADGSQVTQPIQRGANQRCSAVSIIDELSLGRHRCAISLGALAERGRLTFNGLANVVDPIDVRRMWGCLAERIAEETGKEPVSPTPQLPDKPDWEEVAPGIACKLLATDTEKNRVSMLVRLAPGTDYPRHRHAGVEELHLLHGELMIDDKKLYPGDYNRAEADTVDHRVWSETGCTCVPLTSIEDVLL
jgi:quercetin dioxygenase-like cupin family protein